MNGQRPDPQQSWPRASEPSPVIRRASPPQDPARGQSGALQWSHAAPPLSYPSQRPRHRPPSRDAATSAENSRAAREKPTERPLRPAAPKRRRKPAWRRLVPAILLTGLLLASAGIVGGAFWIDTSLDRSPVLADYPGRPLPGRGITWLLVGSDSRQGLTAQQQADLSTGGDIGNGRTDTILLIHVPALGSGAATTMVSIPRDSYVPIPGYGKDKINAAFTMGEAPLLARTVEQATGLRLDHYVEIGFGGFAELVDALGGVTVCPTAPISDPLAGIDLPPGCQRLNGRNALGFVRTRATPRADLDRMVNQRLFMSALLHRTTSPAVWLNPWRWYSVPHAAADALTVDEGDRVWDLARLAWALHGSATTLTVPIREFTGSDAGSVVVWDHDAARQLFDALATDAPVPQDMLEQQP